MTAPPKPAKKALDIVGLREIAKMLEVNERTPTIWRSRSQEGTISGEKMPDPLGYISNNRPIWEKKDIWGWAQRTGRLPSQRKAAAQDKAKKAADARKKATAAEKATA